MVTTLFRQASLVLMILILFHVVSCNSIRNSLTNVRDYPEGRPFVYDYSIELEGKFTTDERKQLTEQLQQQLHDSIRVRKIQKVIFQTLKAPPVFDTANVDRSIVYMRALLNAEGYLRDTITYSISFDTVRDQIRTYVNFLVEPRKLFRIDSLVYNIRSTASPDPDLDTLQKLTDESLANAYIRKGSPFSKSLLAAERERLADIYRDHGYLKFTNEELLVLWDTVGLALLQPTLDPIEQAQMIERLRQRRENPTADIEFRLRENQDTTLLTRYFIGNITVYPDINADTAFFYPRHDIVQGYRFISYEGLFRPDKLTDYIYLRQGDMYRQSNFLRTRNRFNAITAWRLVTINPIPRPGQDTVDFDIRLIPAEKYHFQTNLDASRNQGNLGVEGNLLGLGYNVFLQDRNFLRGANLATWKLRYGVELGSTTDRPIETQQFTFSNTIEFPRKVIPKFPLIPARQNIRTFFTLSGGYTDRRTYFDVRSVNTSWGYEWGRDNRTWGVRWPNIEVNSLKRKERLDELIQNNKSYRYIFNTGLITSGIVNRNFTWGQQNITKQFIMSSELAGFFAGFINGSKYLDSSLYRFIKTDLQFKRTQRIRRTAIALRAFAGIGVSLTRNATDTVNFHLPFFRQYYAGGPNSMRAWRIRRLGPGSAVKSYLPTQAPDRFGDLRLELNGEYRFYMFEIKGVFFNGALFTDIGNVWFLRENADFPRGNFTFRYFIDDLAIGAGTGLRVDFGFLKIRFDYAYKVRDPSPDILRADARNRWFYKWELLNGQFQLGIDYPF